jgi:DNA-binding NarL/FixJ family response regulator
MSQSSSEETRISVLVIGSEPEEYKSIQDFLAQETEFQLVGLVTTGHKGVEKAKELKPDIIIIDISTPDMDSIAVVGLVREVAPSACIIMMSMSNEAGWLRRALLAGTHDFLSKPLEADYFISALRDTYKRFVE